MQNTANFEQEEPQGNAALQADIRKYEAMETALQEEVSAAQIKLETAQDTLDKAQDALHACQGT